jgi:hypothetical protein
MVSGFAAVAFFVAHFYWLGLIALVIGAVALTTRYGVEIDFNSKEYQEYFWILGLRQGKRFPFESIQYLFIKDFRMSETFNSRVNSSTIIRDEFRGYVKFSEESKIHILTKDDYNQLVSLLKDLAKQFQVGLVDYTFGHRVQLM